MYDVYLHLHSCIPAYMLPCFIDSSLLDLHICIRWFASALALTWRRGSGARRSTRLGETASPPALGSARVGSRRERRGKKWLPACAAARRRSRAARPSRDPWARKLGFRGGGNPSNVTSRSSRPPDFPHARFANKLYVACKMDSHHWLSTMLQA